jgi:hypothetical protein
MTQDLPKVHPSPGKRKLRIIGHLIMLSSVFPAILKKRSFL